MFKLAPKDKTYKRVVQIQVPVEDGGNEAVSFTAHFKLLAISELRTLLNRIREKKLPDDVLIKEVLAGWDDIEAADGSPLRFTPDNLLQLLDIGYWSRGVVDDYLAFAGGLPAKN